MLPSRKDPSHPRPEECYAQDESHRRRRARAGARRRDHGVRRARRRDQSAVLGAEGARQHYPYSRPPCRGRVAHGGGLHPRRGRQHRRVHRHLGPGRHRYDHRAVLGIRGFDSYSVHHGPSAARAHAQGRFPGGGHPGDRQACQQMGDHGHGTGAGTARVSAGVSPDALGPPGSGPDRPAVRRTDGRNRVRSGHLRAVARLQTEGDGEADREGAGDAQRRRPAGDHCGRRHYQCRRLRAARAVRGGNRRAGDPHADGLGHDSG